MYRSKCSLVLMVQLAATTAAAGSAFEWTAYGGDGRGQRHAPLAQITPANVGGLELAGPRENEGDDDTDECELCSQRLGTIRR